jgi:hypothetical protein
MRAVVSRGPGALRPSLLSGAALHVCTQSVKKFQDDYSWPTIGSKSVGDHEFRF